MSIATAGRWTQSMGMQGLQAVGAMSVYGWRMIEKTGQRVNAIMFVVFRALGWLYPKLAKLEFGWLQMLAIVHAWFIHRSDKRYEDLQNTVAKILAQVEEASQKNQALMQENAQLKAQIEREKNSA